MWLIILGLVVVATILAVTTLYYKRSRKSEQEIEVLGHIIKRGSKVRQYRSGKPITDTFAQPDYNTNHLQVLGYLARQRYQFGLQHGIYDDSN